jgi:hypothetical protein
MIATYFKRKQLQLTRLTQVRQMFKLARDVQQEAQPTILLQMRARQMNQLYNMPHSSFSTQDAALAFSEKKPPKGFEKFFKKRQEKGNSS